MDQAKSLVVASGTLGLGVGVVACQIGLYMGAAATNVVLDGVIATKNFSGALVTRGVNMTMSVEHQVANLIEAVHLYAKELRKNIENGAVETVTNPGDVVLRAIRAYSAKLNEQLGKLRASGSKLLSQSVLNHVSSAIAYIEQFDQNLANAENIEQVNGQVIEEAKHKFQEVAQWSASFINKNNKGMTKQNGAQ